MATLVHVWPFLAADERWRSKEEFQSNATSDSSVNIRALVEGTYVDWFDTDSEMSDSQRNSYSSFTARFNTDPNNGRQFLRKCPAPVRNAVDLSKPIRTRRYFDFRLKKWKTILVNDLDIRAKLKPGIKIPFLIPNPFRSQRVRDMGSSGAGSLGFLTIIDPPPDFTGTSLWFYQGDLSKANHGPISDILRNALRGPVAELYRPAALWDETADLRELLDQKVVGKIYKKLLNQKVDLATAIAEGAQAYKMLVDLSTRLAQFLIAVKNLNLNQSVNALQPILKDLLPLTRKKLANDFLAYRYGISPLIGDIQGSADALVEYFASLPRSVAKGRNTSHHEEYSYDSIDGILLSYYTDTQLEISYKVSFEIPLVESRLVEELGFTNPANVIWELVPFSFVYDWFLPIGNYLKLVSAADNLTLKYCERTTFINQFRVINFTVPAGDYNGYRLDTDINGYYQVQDLMTVRELTLLPKLPNPKFKNPLSTGHVLNAIALFQQLLK